MWEIYEHRTLVKRLSRIPDEVLKRYEKWKDIVAISGPDGLRQIKGFHDEALQGEWKGHRMKDYRKAQKTIEVSVGESVRIMRELQELSQTDLAKLTGIPQSTISGIENDRINLGVERAKTLARALKCHPAVLVFPGWEIKSLEAA